MTDLEIKNKVTNLKNFYNQIFINLTVNAFAVLIWLLLSVDAYWPIWVHFTSTAILILEAYRLSLITAPSVDILPFLRKEWEEETFLRLKKLHNAKTNSTTKKEQTSPQNTTTKKPKSIKPPSKKTNA